MTQRKIEIQRELDISLDATLKEREQIEDMVPSNFNDLGRIGLEGVDRVEKDSPMINKL